MTKPLISVVMGVYNPPSKEALWKAVDSILCQTYENIEFIICDDGSNLITKKWLCEITELDQRIKLLINEKNIGLAATLNRCIFESQGEYIARQDADDYSEKNRLKKQLNFLKNNAEYAFVGSNIYYFSEQSVWGQFIYPAQPKKKDFLWVSPFCHGSVMFRKAAIEKVGLYRVSKETWRCEDYDLFMRMYVDGFIAANLEEKLYYFCEDANTIDRRKFVDRLCEVKVRAKYFGRLGLYPKGVLYLVKPLLVGLLPKQIVTFLKDIIYRRKY